MTGTALLLFPPADALCPMRVFRTSALQVQADFNALASSMGGQVREATGHTSARLQCLTCQRCTSSS